MSKVTLTAATLVVLLGLGGCMEQESSSCSVNEQGAVVSEGHDCPSSHDRFPRRRQGPGTW